MKKRISIILVIAMLLSMLVSVVPVSAAGIHIIENFSSMDSFTQNFIAGAFYIHDDMLYGYAEAKALQTKYYDDEYFKDSNTTWLTYDASVTLALADDELSDTQRFVNLVYCNDNPVYYGRTDDRVMMAFTYDIEEECFRFTEGWNNTDPAGQLMEPVYKSVPVDDGEYFFTLGISVDRGRIRCFYNDELIFDFIDREDEYLIADTIESPFLMWQDGNFIQISNITIADVGYLFPGAGVNTDGRESGFYMVPVTSECNNDTLVFDIMYNDNAYVGATQYGLRMSWSDNLACKSIKKVYSGGMFLTDERDENTQLILHVVGNGTFPKGRCTEMVRVTFDVTGFIGGGVTLDLCYDPDNMPTTIEGSLIDEQLLPTMGEKTFYYDELMGTAEPEEPEEPELPDPVIDPDLPEIPVVPDSMPRYTGEGFYLEPASVTKEEITFDLLFDAPSAYPITQYGLLLKYSDNLTLTDCTSTMEFGSFITSQYYTNYPYMVLWASGIKELETGMVHKLAEFTFKINDLDEDITVGLSYDSENMPAGIDKTEYTEGQIPVMKSITYTRGELASEFPEIHEWVYQEGRVPTCAQPGYMNYRVCSGCGAVEYDVLPATGEHTGGTATCTKRAVCDVCRCRYGELDPTKHGKTELRGDVEVSDSADGYTGDICCKDCGEIVVKGSVIPTLTKPGDATGDGKVNISDVSLILKSIAKWNVNINKDVCDVNDDGKVNISDVSLILKYIAKWNVELK